MSTVTAVVVKETPESKVGITLKDMKGKIIITGISPASIFAGTELKVGHQVFSVNGILASKVSAMDVVMMLKAAESELKIVAGHGGFVSATVSKPDPDCKLGIGVIERDGQIYITSIAEDGLFGGTDLQEGYRVVSVNKKACKGLSSMEAVALFKSAEEDLVVMAEDPGYVKAVVQKTSPTQKCGIQVKNMGGSVYITNINPNGLFADTELKTGMKVVRVNKKEASTLSTADALKLFKTAKSEVTVVAEYVGFVGVTVYKDSPDSKVGIKLKSKDGQIFISSISPESLFADTDIKVGMKLVSVNKHDCAGLTPFEAIEFFKASDGAITVFAQEDE